MGDDPGTMKSRLFLSYSRRDSAFVDELIISVESYGFEVLLDREDLFPGEQWEPRLHRFISEADTTVCVVSANWVASEQCVKELAIALDQGRRIIPVIIDQIHPNSMPEQLARLQFVFFHGEGRSYARGVVSLVTALRTDIDWVRQQSRLLDKAQEWNQHGRSKALALRGASLDEALKWVHAPRPEHTRILPVVAEFVEASRKAQDDDDKSRLRGRFIFTAVAGVALVGVLSSGLLAVETLRRAEAAKVAEQGRLILAEQLRARELDEELTKAVFELNQEDVIQEAPEQAETESPGELTEDIEQAGSGAGAGRGDDPSPLPAPPPPVEGPSPELPAPSVPPRQSPDDGAGPVAKLNSSDKSTRVQAGQQVVDMIRSQNGGPVLNDLIAELEPAKYDSMSSSGRFNILYMLNVHEDWRNAPEAPALTSALDRIEASGAVGGQSRDCIDSLRAKLAGQTGVSGRCGGK
jgi:hypothetical protein